MNNDNEQQDNGNIGENFSDENSPLQAPSPFKEQVPESKQDAQIQNSATKKASAYAMPLAIIIAGAMITGAILYNTPTKTQKDSEQPTVLGAKLYNQISLKLGIDKQAFAECLANREMADNVFADLTDATTSGGTGTPYVIIINEAGQKIAFSGALPYERIKLALDQSISGQITAPVGAEQNIVPVNQDDHVRGDIKAPIALIEFSDFQCPFCSSIHTTLKRLIQEYDGQVKWVYRHFPLSSIHAEAAPAAVASECIARLAGNDAFWQFADVAFSLK
jgi:protein-disulfide isomerase